MRERKASDWNTAPKDGFTATGHRHGPASRDERPSPDGRQRLRAVTERAIATAARAPSAHNTQPWVPRIDAPAAGPLTVTVSIDPDRTLPLADPLHMDTLLGIGCWLEAFSIACDEEGADVALTGVAGDGPQAVVTLTVAAGPGGHPRSSEAPGALTSRDVTARQVDRGRLHPDDAALDAAVAEYQARRPDTPAASTPAIRVVPEDAWLDMDARAALHIAQSPDMLRETLDWLRLDPADPRWHEDGLTAECLRISTPAATGLHRILASPIGHTAVRTARTWQPALERALVGRRSVARALRRVKKDPPTRLVLGTSAAESAREVPTGDWVLLGRELMAFWLVLHRHGLRVNAQSEIKDSPANAESLARVFGRTTAVPFATFSVGRSASPAPRSHRRPRTAQG